MDPQVEHPDREMVKNLVREAFASVEYPGDWALRDSVMGDEPYLVEQEFKGKTDWRALDAAFLDQAPAGFGSALSFFPDMAFRFYLPAYLIAELDGALKTADPLFHLCHGFEDDVMLTPINPKFYGARTWIDHARHRFSTFTIQQAAAVVAYLRHEQDADDRTYLDRHMIDRALTRYWIAHARGPTHPITPNAAEPSRVFSITSVDMTATLTFTPNAPGDLAQGLRVTLRTSVGDCEFLGENSGVHLGDLVDFSAKLNRFMVARDEPVILDASDGCRFEFYRRNQRGDVSLKIQVSRVNHGFDPLRTLETALTTTFDLDDKYLAEVLHGFAKLAQR
jgi:uncharacterized protein DUF6714